MPGSSLKGWKIAYEGVRDKAKLRVELGLKQGGDVMTVLWSVDSFKNKFSGPLLM